MNNKNKSKVMIILTAVLVLTFFFLKAVLPYEDYSENERRKLASEPELTVKTFFSGNYGKRAEEYSKDHFLFRDSLRKLKVKTSKYIFMKSDDRGLFTEGDHIVRLEYPFNEDKVYEAAMKFNEIIQKNLEEGHKAYISVIPDKNAFSSGLKMDYDKLEEYVKNKVFQAEYIKISHLLNMDSYYYTDPHWKAESIIPVYEELSSAMGNSDFVKYDIADAGNFSGAYSRQLPLKAGKDRIRYMWNDIMNDYKACNLEKEREIPLYNEEKVKGSDPYERFLDGPSSVITIENPNIKETKELVVFRDSFGSSIGPLLAEKYSKITLIDVRYIPSALAGKFADFKNADILFLYSAAVLNNSETLK